MLMGGTQLGLLSQIEIKDTCANICWPSVLLPQLLQKM